LLDPVVANTVESRPSSKSELLAYEDERTFPATYDAVVVKDEVRAYEDERTFPAM
jgi:hypothetical protein